MKESEIKSFLMNDLKKIFEKSGISLEIIKLAASSSDMILKLKYEGKTITLAGGICSSLHFSEFYRELERLKKVKKEYPDYYPVLIGTKFSPEKQSFCKNQGIFYLDLTGNIFIKTDSILIDMRGREDTFRLKQSSRNPFADKASLVLRALLENPVRPMGVREIAALAHISPGWVSQVSQKLEELDYLAYSKNKIKLTRIESLLEDWVEFYKYKKNNIHKYYCNAGVVEIIDRLRGLAIPEQIEYALSLQAGGYLLAPHAVFQEVHVYLPGDPAKRKEASDFWKNKMKLEEASRLGNFYLMEPYYSHSVFFGKQKVRGLFAASDIQVYLDLRKYPLRGEEQAGHLFNERIKPVIGKNRNA